MNQALLNNHLGNWFLFQVNLSPKINPQNPGKLGSLGGLSGKKPNLQSRTKMRPSPFNPKGESMMDSSSEEEDPTMAQWKNQRKQGNIKQHAAPNNNKLSYLEHLDKAREKYRNN